MTPQLLAAAELVEKLTDEDDGELSVEFRIACQLLAEHVKAGADETLVDKSYLDKLGLIIGPYDSPKLKAGDDSHHCAIGVFAVDLEDGNWLLWLGEDGSSGVWCQSFKTVGQLLLLLAALGVDVRT